jgi:hypothetical protein
VRKKMVVFKGLCADSGEIGKRGSCSISERWGYLVGRRSDGEGGQNKTRGKGLGNEEGVAFRKGRRTGISREVWRKMRENSDRV